MFGTDHITLDSGVAETLYPFNYVIKMTLPYQIFILYLVHPLKPKFCIVWYILKPSAKAKQIR